MRNIPKPPEEMINYNEEYLQLYLLNLMDVRGSVLSFTFKCASNRANPSAVHSA